MTLDQYQMKLLDRLRALKVLMDQRGISPGDLPLFAFDLREVREIFSVSSFAYTYPEANPEISRGTHCCIYGFNGIAV